MLSTVACSGELPGWREAVASGEEKVDY